MRYGYIFTGAATALLIAGSAYAAVGDVTGTVNVIGHVGGQCSVLTNGETVSSSFTGQIDLGELAGTDGRLNTSITGGPVTFTVVCNTTAPSISLAASSLVGSASPPDGTYTNIVGYRANLTLAEVSSGSETFHATSENSASPTATTGTLAAPLSGANNNVSVSVDNLTSNGGILTAGTYGVANSADGGVISITITPS